MLAVSSNSLAKELNIFSSEMASDNVVTCPEFSRVTAINMVRDFESELTTSFTASTSNASHAGASFATKEVP
ncbi:hypothetical protein ACFJGX_03975 [Hydrogenophaga sp. UC242_50]|uniref:hypothetical protein n=1 Tax=Hydrogenophaga sp. UC242_50 TaxID=3350169 RepID=UPI0036D2B2F8